LAAAKRKKQEKTPGSRLPGVIVILSNRLASPLFAIYFYLA
jgi:hypothetical protein